MKTIKLKSPVIRTRTGISNLQWTNENGSINASGVTSWACEKACNLIPDSHPIMKAACKTACSVA